ncbi:MAG: hypothetical protein CYG60_15555 [Actinobacteria bacterium]|nr:MAG: hypothetical protein CYG60_15555 [Actinomycetota bacterium]
MYMSLKVWCNYLEIPTFHGDTRRGSEMAARTTTKTETIGGDGPMMLSYTEAAMALGVSVSTISRLVTGGELAAVRSGRRSVKIAPDALAEFVRRGGISHERARKCD